MATIKYLRPILRRLKRSQCSKAYDVKAETAVDTVRDVSGRNDLL